MKKVWRVCEFLQVGVTVRIACSRGGATSTIHALGELWFITTDSQTTFIPEQLHIPVGYTVYMTDISNKPLIL